MDPSPLDLLRKHVAIIDDLRSRRVLRSKNNPAGDYAEWLVVRAFELSLAPKSNAGYDASDRWGVRYEIKARRVTEDNGSRQLSAFRSLEHQPFHWLIGVLFEHNFTVRRAARIPHALVHEQAVYKPKPRHHVFMLLDAVLDDPRVEDVTDTLRAAQGA